jgi:hypothetical protein
MAATVPSMVENIAATMAMIRVFWIALIREWWDPEVNSEVYSSVEKPVQFPSTLASVNENIAMISIGAYSIISNIHRYD